MQKEKAIISLSGKECKKHIQEALKMVFPGTKFSITSSYDSVSVAWTDGPVQQDVWKVLNRFESYTLVRSRSDFYRPTGYEWKGETYRGAQYLSAFRTLSHDRRSVLVAAAAEKGENWQNLNLPEQLAYERAVVASGSLSAHLPADYPDLMKDSRPEVDERVPVTADPVAAPPTTTANVVQLFDSEQRLKNLVQQLTPEQRLKLDTLQKWLSPRDVMEYLETNDLTVDEAFTQMANEIF